MHESLKKYTISHCELYLMWFQFFMNVFNVLMSIARCTKFQRTLTTLIRLYPRMGTIMYFQICHRSGSVWTMLAFKLFHGRMCGPMVCYSAPRLESLPACLDSMKYKKYQQINLLAWKFLIPVCRRTCFCKLLDVVNFDGHKSHWYGLAPVCFLMWIFRSFTLRARYSHRLHRYGLAPVWIDRWYDRVASCVKAFPHT